MQHLKVILSGDGSSTIYNETLQETYHSTHGAIRESVHVFLEKGLKHVMSPGQATNILEIGMGTGLNALLTFQFAKNMKMPVHYTTLEPFPLSTDVLEKLNYEEQLEDCSLEGVLTKIHQATWEEDVSLSDEFTLLKHQLRLQDFHSPDQFDLIYFDAFAPKKQPDLWDVEIFNRLYLSMREGACLVSYCASGQFKRNLREAGFSVEVLPGPPGKKEMTRAIKLQ